MIDSEIKTFKTPKGKKPLVLIVDDRYRAFQSLPRFISKDFNPLWVADEEQGLAVLNSQSNTVSIIIIDIKSAEMGGGGFLQQARRVVPHAAILITAPIGPFLYQGGGFYEYSGPCLKRDLNAILMGIVQKMGAKDRFEKRRTKPDEPRQRFGVIIGKSRGINTIYRLIDKLKHTSSTVLIQGESGTGKELIARTICQTSTRRNYPFVAINCGAIPASLMESELFGHERGAFTSAIQQRKGKFEIASGGTLFLDEIGELDKMLQVKLLRILQEKEFQRVGGNVTIKTDVRIIAATSQDLKKDVKSGHFRDDLFYRLNVVPITIPPLRDRREDIPLLLNHFLEVCAREMDLALPVMTDEVKDLLLCYNYPGNVRELANIVERLLVTCPNGEITIEDLPEELCKKTGAAQATGLIHHLPEGGARLHDVEKELLLKTLEMTKGNKLAAAKMLGITRRLLYLRLSEYALSSSERHRGLHSTDRPVTDGYTWESHRVTA
jgi:DNA-binding NtrC family response regulator